MHGDRAELRIIDALGHPTYLACRGYPIRHVWGPPNSAGQPYAAVNSPPINSRTATPTLKSRLLISGFSIFRAGRFGRQVAGNACVSGGCTGVSTGAAAGGAATGTNVGAGVPFFTTRKPNG